MFRIIKDGVSLGLVERPTYITKADNGCFVLCPEAQARGIAYRDIPYHVIGRPPMEGAEDVMLEAVDGGGEIDKATGTGGILFVTLAEAGSIDAVTAAEHAELFAEWTYPVKYEAGKIVRDPYDGMLYKVNEGQGHTSQEDWAPHKTPALWTKIADPAEEWPAWSQPIGAHDAYDKGDKVSHKDRHWQSTVAANVWEPGVYGWDDVTEE